MKCQISPDAYDIHTGKLPQQHEFANESFVILFRCHFVSPYHVDGSANNVLCFVFWSFL